MSRTPRRDGPLSGGSHVLFQEKGHNLFEILLSILIESDRESPCLYLQASFAPMFSEDVGYLLFQNSTISKNGCNACEIQGDTRNENKILGYTVNTAKRCVCIVSLTNGRREG